MPNKSNMTSPSVAASILLLYFLTACNGLPLCNQQEREALLEFKGGFQNGRELLSSWKGEDCCNWAGVGCHNTTGYVIKLDLSCNSFRCLKGAIHPSLFDLKYIEHLDISRNDFNGTQMPSAIGSFKNLRFLNLSRTGFPGSIPHQLGNLSNLQVLDLSSISFAVSDDTDWLAKLSFLRHLDLSWMGLGKASKLFEALNMLPFLSVIKLTGCGLTRIPSSLQPVNLTSLRTLDLSWNYFDSTVLGWLSNITNLEYLDLTYTRLPPMNTFYFLSNHLCNLHYLDLSNNDYETKIVLSNYKQQFTGCIKNSLQALHFSNNKVGGQFPDFLEDFQSLTYLDFSYNSLSGPLPAFIGNLLSLRYLNLSDNNLNGTIPRSLGRLSYMRELILSNNYFSGEIPADLGNLTSLEKLYLYRNRLVGVIPSSLGRLKSLVMLGLSSNKLEGNIPKSFGQLVNLNTMDLGMNNMEGVLSEQHFSNLVNLSRLDLSNNCFKLDLGMNWVPPFSLSHLYMSSCCLGSAIPSWINTQTNLKVLDLSNSSILGSLPEWLWNLFMEVVDLSFNEINGGLPTSIHNLTWSFLNLHSNHLDGQLPYFSMSHNISSLVLSKNSFSGRIPKSIAELASLTRLDLSENNLSGEIPEELGNLHYLYSLNFSRNHLTGSIPDGFKGLKTLVTLDLSQNNISGEIPQSMLKLRSLETLNLSYNNLYGSIPIGAQFSTFSNLSYIGNPLLCGIPLESCKGSSVHQPGNADYDKIYLSVSIIVGFIFGFWTFWGILLLKVTWRCAYFNVVDSFLYEVFVGVVALLRRCEVTEYKATILQLST